MSDINIASMLKANPSKEEFGQNKASINQSAWKKELESQLYSKQKDTVVSAPANLPVPLPDKSELLKSPTSYFSLMGADNEAKSDVDQAHQHSPDVKYVDASGASVRSAVLHKTNSVLSSVAAGSLTSVTQKGAVQGGGKEVYSGGSFSQSQSYSSPTIKPFNIRLLADGELLIRDYKQGLLSDIKLENIVADLKKVMDKDIEKVRINGDVVWQSNKKLSTDQYIIDLV